MTRIRLSVALLVLFPTICVGQNLSEQLSGAPHFLFEEWRSLTAGKTVIYGIDGEVFGYETYRTNSNQVSFRLQSGECIDGEWYMEGNAFCFNWEDGFINCFHHKKLGETIYVISLNNGVETDDVQRVSRITHLPAACGPALLSSLEPEARP